MTPSHHHSVGLSRRAVVQAGYTSLLGIGLPALLGQRLRAAEAIAPARKRGEKSIIIVFLTGGASHHDTFDMKPEAPAEIRGAFQPISTAIPGYSICEHLPHLAAMASKFAVVRSFSHDDTNHFFSTHYVLTGEKQPGGFNDKVASRDDWPSYSAALRFLRPRHDGTPCGVNLPTFLRDGPLTWPGQHAGFLSSNNDPWQITSNPNTADFRVEALTLSPGIDVPHLGRRQTLLEEINRQQTRLGDVLQYQRLHKDQQLAVSMLTTKRLTQAFELDHESPVLREKYGRTETGQSLLLARRLVESGVSIVQVNVGRVQNWDTHSNIFPRLKDTLLPPVDRGVSTLLDDLASRGMLDETLVIMLGEFGRTPTINSNHGRDHWGSCFFGLFAGAGVQPGQVIGRSDKEGGYPVTDPYSPSDLGATVYHLLGIPDDVEIRDRLNRPIRLNQGHVIEPLFTGASA